MTPLQVVSKATKTADYHYKSDVAFTSEDALAFIDKFIDALRYSRKRRNSRRSKKPAYLQEDYIRVFRMLGAIPSNYVAQRMLRAACDRFPDKVIEGIEERYDKTYTLSRYFERCILSLVMPGGREHYTANGSYKVEDKKGQYGYIPSATECLADLWVNQDPYLMKGKNFIDIGCGIADKTIFVSLLPIPMNAYGVEYDYINAELGRKAVDQIRFSAGIEFCNRCGSRGVWKDSRGKVCTNTSCAGSEKYQFRSKYVAVTSGDAFKLKFDKYDRVYTYSPISKESYRRKFYSHIWKTLPKSAEWFEVMSVQDVFETANEYGEAVMRDGVTSYTSYRDHRFISIKKGTKNV